MRPRSRESSPRRRRRATTRSHAAAAAAAVVAGIAKFLLLLLSSAPIVSASGVGPVGVAPVNDRYVLVADKTYYGLVLVDLHGGGVKGKRDFRTMPGRDGRRYDPADSSTWEASMVDVATCGDARFAWVTANHGAKMYRVEFGADLRDASPEEFSKLMSGADVVPVGEVSTDRLFHPRHLAIEPSCRRGFVVGFDKDSRDKMSNIYRFKPRTSNVSRSDLLRRVLSRKKAIGVHLWYDGSYLRLIVVGFDEPVLISDRRGDTLIEMDPCEGDGNSGCPCDGRRRNWNARGRDALVDPNTGRIIYLTKGKERGSVLVELDAPDGYNSTNTTSCSVLAGDMNRGSGWRDGVGTDAHFSRPHAMDLLPGGDAVILTDIDNRALRIVQLAGPDRGDVRSVLYSHYNDAMFFDVPRRRRRKEEGRDEEVDNVTATGPAAEAECNRRGMALCTAVELSDAHRSERLERQYGLDGGDMWTSHVCASCWLLSNDFYKKGRGDRCTNGNLYSSGAYLEDLPTTSSDNFCSPSYWNGGRVAARIVDRNGKIETRCVDDDDETLAFRCCERADVSLIDAIEEPWRTKCRTGEGSVEEREEHCMPLGVPNGGGRPGEPWREGHHSKCQ